MTGFILRVVIVAFGLWLEYAPQPLGASDRKSRSAAALAPMERLIALWSKSAVSDPSTAAVLTETMRGHASVFSTLGDEGINIEMISTSPIKISCVVSADVIDRAVRALHQAFELGADQVEAEHPFGPQGARV